MLNWRRNVYFLMVTSFLASSGMSIIMPFLPLYVEQLGVTDPKAVGMWSAIAYSANFLAAAFFSPVWGNLADRFGRKLMILRSGFGMGIVIFLMGTVHSVEALVGLRLLNGVIAGFIAASNAFVGSNTPREHVGYALGLIQGASVAGNIMGPLFGGAIVYIASVRYVFFLTSIGLLISSATVLIFVHEKFERPTVALKTRSELAAASVQAHPTHHPHALGSSVRALLGQRAIMALLFATFLAQFSQSTVEPILTSFVKTLETPQAYLTLMVGLVFSVAGLSTFIAAPLLGRYADRHGYKRVLQFALAGAALMYLPQGLVHTSWQLLWIRFALGAFIGGILPSIQSLISHLTPDSQRATGFGLNQSAVYVGNFLGPLVGGVVSGWLGFRAIFSIASVFLLADLLWVISSVPNPQAQAQSKLAADNRKGATELEPEATASQEE